MYDYVQIAYKKFLSKDEAEAFVTKEEAESFLQKEKADRKYLKANEDNVLDGRLDMKKHRIIGLSDPLQEDGAVTRRYISSRIQALVDENSVLRRRIDRLEILAQQ